MEGLIVLELVIFNLVVVVNLFHQAVQLLQGHVQVIAQLRQVLAVQSQAFIHNAQKNMRLKAFRMVEFHTTISLLFRTELTV